MVSQGFYLSFLVGVAWLVGIATNAELISPTVTNATRESKEMAFVFPKNYSPKKVSSIDFDEINYYQSEGRRSPSKYASAAGQAGVIKERVGLSDIIQQRLACPTCPTCPNCPTCTLCTRCVKCDTCPAPCPETTVAAIPVTIPVPNVDSCTVNVVAPGTSFGRCSFVTTRPSGVFSVVFGATAVATPFSTVFIGIVATCPNTRVRVTCGDLPARYRLTTQSGQTIAANSPAGTAVTENGFIQIILGQIAATAAPVTIQCSWSAIP